MRIKIFAPKSTTNSAIIYFGNSASQEDWLAIDGSRDTFVHINDPAKIYIKGAVGDKVHYRLET